jgi:hypothetical protein
MFYTYILRSEQNPDRFYYGFSSDLKKRLRVHNQGENVSTKTGAPWTLAGIVISNPKARPSILSVISRPHQGKPSLGRGFCAPNLPRLPCRS